MIKDSFPKVTGHVTLELIRDGVVEETVYGNNIWTTTGRQFLSDLVRYSDYSNDTKVRQDRIAYLGVGLGTQVASINILSLVEPTPFEGTTFLAKMDSSSSASGVDNSGNPYTAVTFVRNFTAAQLLDFDNSNGPLVLREVGLYTDGDQNNDFAVGNIESVNSMSGQTPGFAPVAYKTFEPITKTGDYSLRITWQVRFA